MSLINDAIKRASAAQPPPSSTGQAEVTFRPVEHRNHLAWGIFFIPMFLGCAMVLGILFLAKGWQASHREWTGVTLTESVPVAAREMPSPPVPLPRQNAGPGTDSDRADITPAPTDTDPGAAMEPAQATAAPETPPAEAKVAIPAPPPPLPTEPSFPELKLQGIFYRPSNPSAVINSKTVYRGDLIQEAEVTKITRQNVTVVWKGETKVLTLP